MEKLNNEVTTKKLEQSRNSTLEKIVVIKRKKKLKMGKKWKKIVENPRRSWGKWKGNCAVFFSYGSNEIE